MANKIIKTLTLGGNTYEIYDETARNNITSVENRMDELEEKSASGILVDTELSETSANPVQNAVVTAKFSQLSDTVNDMKENGTGTTVTGGSVKTILENIMAIMKAQVNLDGTPQAYSPDISDIASQTDTLIANLGTTDDGGTGEEENPDTGETEVTLSSISATYTGGEVAVGTALTDLTGITVTALYSDGSTANVTDYALSGTIVEGENIVTVNYGGKTTTFIVTGVTESGSEAEGVAVAMLDEVTLNNGNYIYYYSNDDIEEYQVDDTNESVTTNGTAFNWYSDEGITAYSGSIATRANIPCMTSENVFEEDTEVKILLQFSGYQHYDCFTVGCTDWDGVSAPSANNVYNCQSVGTNSWVTGGNDITKDHEITYTVKAGTRLIVASYISPVTVFILRPDAVLDAQLLSGESYRYSSASEQVFDEDITIHITASSTVQQHDAVICGCIKDDSIASGSHVYHVQKLGDAKWENPYVFDATYTVKAGFKFLLCSYWSRANMDVFTVEVI